MNGSTHKYRRDIDGLRAVAVLTVVFYHLGMPFQFDGYIGVDIFFVISGFLITGIIYREAETGAFSLANFYVRRIKRILPALYVVVSVTLLIGILLMLPSDLKDLGKSGFAAVLSASNIYFWYSEDTSYFARSSELLPLLHTWSLGVEEQFYVLWPLLVLISYRLYKLAGVILISAVISILSYIYAEVSLAEAQSFSYYMLPARAGELLTGALAFLATVRKLYKIDKPWILEAISLLGAILIVVSLFFANFGSSFPGFNAFLPCLGTAMILYAGVYRSTVVSQFLAQRPMVAVGLISYSLYLWHWPVLAFARYLYTSLSLGLALICFTLMLGLAWLSYRYVELPFRQRKVSATYATLVYGIAPAVVLAFLSLHLYTSDGLLKYISGKPGYNDALQLREDHARPAFSYDFVCQTNEHSTETFSGPRCVIGRSEVKPHILLWGDSHAAHHVGFFSELASHAGVAFRNLELGNCPPVLHPDLKYIRKRVEHACKNFREQIGTEIEYYNTVILGGVWDSYLSTSEFEAHFRETVSLLSEGVDKVILLGQIPRFDNYDRNCLLRNNRLIEINCIKHAEKKVETFEHTNNQIRLIAEDFENVYYFSLTDYVCDPYCSPYREGLPIYFDRGHLSISGSKWLGLRYAQQRKFPLAQ